MILDIDRRGIELVSLLQVAQSSAVVAWQHPNSSLNNCSVVTGVYLCGKHICSRRKKHEVHMFITAIMAPPLIDAFAFSRSFSAFDDELLLSVSSSNNAIMIHESGSGRIFRCCRRVEQLPR